MDKTSGIVEVGTVNILKKSIENCRHKTHYNEPRENKEKEILPYDLSPICKNNVHHFFEKSIGRRLSSFVAYSKILKNPSNRKTTKK